DEGGAATTECGTARKSEPICSATDPTSSDDGSGAICDANPKAYSGSRATGRITASTICISAPPAANSHLRKHQQSRECGRECSGHTAWPIRKDCKRFKIGREHV